MRVTKGIALAVAAMAMTCVAESAMAQQDQSDGPGYGATTGPSMMGPNGMMGSGGMGPWMMGPGGAGAMMGWHGRSAWMCTLMGAHIDGRLAYLEAELKITPAQQPLWKAYADAVRANAKSLGGHCAEMAGQGRPPASTLPDRLDLHERFMADRLQALRTQSKALKPLYAALDADQKRTADDLGWWLMAMM